MKGGLRRGGGWKKKNCRKSLSTSKAFYGGRCSLKPVKKPQGRSGNVLSDIVADIIPEKQKITKERNRGGK